MSRAALAALVVGKEAASASAVTVHNLTYQVSLSLLFFSLSPGCVREGAPKLTPSSTRLRIVHPHAPRSGGHHGGSIPSISY
jgi:hypothetical protein